MTSCRFSATAFEHCTRISLNFYRLANECNGRIFMHFLSDAALVEVLPPRPLPPQLHIMKSKFPEF